MTWKNKRSTHYHINPLPYFTKFMLPTLPRKVNLHNVTTHVHRDFICGFDLTSPLITWLVQLKANLKNELIITYLVVQLSYLRTTWTIICICRSSEHTNMRPQMLHCNGFRPVCVIICPERTCLFWRIFPQMGHMHSVPCGDFDRGCCCCKWDCNVAGAPWGKVDMWGGRWEGAMTGCGWLSLAMGDSEWTCAILTLGGGVASGVWLECIVTICCSNSGAVANILSHWLHMGWACCRMCLLSDRWLLNPFPQTLQLQGSLSSPACMRRCLRRLPEAVKVSLQTSHTYGRSPVCVLMCSLRLRFSVKVFPQVSHLKGFSPVWTAECFTLSRNIANPSPQTSHL